MGFNKEKRTKRCKFLTEMDQVVPWNRLVKRIEPHYPKAGNGTQAKGLELMLRICFVQHCFTLSDPAMEDEIYESTSVRRFLKLAL